MKTHSDLIAIGEVATRTGMSISTIRYYEEKGLVEPIRNSGGHRRFLRSDIRRLSFIHLAQRLGLTLSEIQKTLERLPKRRTPTQGDWARISKGIMKRLDDQISALQQMKDTLDGCIGCGCLSLKNCALYNPNDIVSRHGAGPRILLGDLPDV